MLHLHVRPKLWFVHSIIADRTAVIQVMYTVGCTLEHFESLFNGLGREVSYGNTNTKCLFVFVKVQYTRHALFTMYTSVL